MKRIALAFSGIAILLLCVTACDFIRSLAGRPTSAEIESKKGMIAAKERAEQEKADSIDRVAARLAREQDCLDSLKATGCVFTEIASLNGRVTSDLANKYYIICGAFADEANAGNMAKDLKDKGYACEIILYRNGRNVVAACPTDDVCELYGAYSSLSEAELIPADSWILVND